LKYSVIIPAWNEEAYLPATLASIRQVIEEVLARVGHVGELIVVDNNSDDATPDIAQAAGAVVVHEPINQISRARNRGAASATGELLIFLDADTRCTSDLLIRVLSLVESGKVVAGGSIIASDSPIPRTAERCVQFWNWLSRSLRLAAGCFVFCRRDAFDAVGGFSDKVYAGEEIFLSRQLKRWAKKHQLLFRIITEHPVETSPRKLYWYGPLSLAKQVVLMLVPGAVFSRRLCGTWYDTKADRH